MSLMHNGHLCFSCYKIMQINHVVCQWVHLIQMFIENFSCSNDETSNVSANMTLIAKLWNNNFIIVVNGYFHLSTLLVICFVEFRVFYSSVLKAKYGYVICLGDNSRPV